MRKPERQEMALIIGAIILLISFFTMIDTITKPWTLENVLNKILQLVGEGFSFIIGGYIFAWGISDKAGEAAGDFLRVVWDRFLKALGR